MSDIILLTSYLNHPNTSKRERSIRSLKKFLQTEDLDTAEVQRVIKRINRIDSPSAKEVLCLYEELRNKRLSFEDELLGYVNKSRIKDKEFFEAKAFYQKVSPFFGILNMIVDNCAGNGLNGIIWALEGKTQKVLLLDREINPYFQGLIQYVSTLKDINVEYQTADIKEAGLPEADLITSIHACGTLTDRVIEQAIEQGSPFAVMPCCQSQSVHLNDEILKYFENKRDFIDITRVQNAQNNNYNIILRNVDPKITDKNRIIVGFPRNSTS